MSPQGLAAPRPCRTVEGRRSPLGAGASSGARRVREGRGAHGSRGGPPLKRRTTSTGRHPPLLSPPSICPLGHRPERGGGRREASTLRTLPFPPAGRSSTRPSFPAPARHPRRTRGRYLSGRGFRASALHIPSLRREADRDGLGSLRRLGVSCNSGTRDTPTHTKNATTGISSPWTRGTRPVSGSECPRSPYYTRTAPKAPELESHVLSCAPGLRSSRRGRGRRGGTSAGVGWCGVTRPLPSRGTRRPVGRGALPLQHVTTRHSRSRCVAPGPPGGSEESWAGGTVCRPRPRCHGSPRSPLTGTPTVGGGAPVCEWSDRGE